MPPSARYHVHFAPATQVALCLILWSAEAAAQPPLARQPNAPAQLVEAVEKIKREYIDPIDDGKLAAGCREGMLSAADPAILPQVTQAESARPASVVDEFVNLSSNIAQRSPGAGDQAKLVGACLRGALRTLDRNSTYLDEEEFRELQVGSAPVGGIGVELKLEAGFPIVVAPIEGGPGERAGLKTGDIVAAIDAVSTQGHALADVVKRLRGVVGSATTLTIVREDSPQPLTFAFTREVIRIQSVKWKSVVPGYAYIRIVQFQETTGSLVAQAIEGAYRENQGDLKGLILDLRNNSGGLLNACVAVAAAFLPRGALIVYTDGRSEDSRMRLNASPQHYLRGRVQLDYIGKLPPAVKTVPMVVLVNGVTASGSELLATALRDHKRARILGARTFGLGTVTTIIPLASNTALKLISARLFGPNGKTVAPVIPDILFEQNNVPATAYGSADDAQLIQAVKMLGGEPLPEQR